MECCTPVSRTVNISLLFTHSYVIIEMTENKEKYREVKKTSNLSDALYIKLYLAWNSQFESTITNMLTLKQPKC